MNCGSWGVKQILIGLHRVGMVGLGQALREVANSGLAERATIIDSLMDTLSSDNYIPEAELEAYHNAIWREYLRFKGEDFSAFYSKIDVTIFGSADEERRNFADLTRSVFSDFELEPVITFAIGTETAVYPQLAIGENIIISGTVKRGTFKAAVDKSISDW